MRSFNNNSKFGYQGSERNKELGDNEYYTHFRGLDVDIVRWKQVDPKANEQAGWSPYASMNNNPVINTDINGDRIHANLKTWLQIWRQARIDPVFMAEIKRQISHVRTSSTNLPNGRVHTETRKQHYYYGINKNTNTNIQQAVYANQAISSQRIANNVPATSDNYPKQSFNINKTESLKAFGQGDETSDKSYTKATTIISDNSYQNGTMNITFTPTLCKIKHL